MLFRRTDPDILRARRDSALAVVERRTRVHIEAVAGYLERSGSPASVEQLDAAEELLYIAQWELQRAERELARAQRPWWVPTHITWRSVR